MGARELLPECPGVRPGAVAAHQGNEARGLEVGRGLKKPLGKVLNEESVKRAHQVLPGTLPECQIRIF